MDRKTQVIFWIAATIIGTVGIMINVRAYLTGRSNTLGVILMFIMGLLLVITFIAKPPAPGRDKGDTM